MTKSAARSTKNRARSVSHDFQQRHGVINAETLATVIRFSALCLFLALVATEDLGLYQKDVKKAFFVCEKSSFFQIFDQLIFRFRVVSQNAIASIPSYRYAQLANLVSYYLGGRGSGSDRWI